MLLTFVSGFGGGGVDESVLWLREKMTIGSVYIFFTLRRSWKIHFIKLTMSRESEVDKLTDGVSCQSKAPNLSKHLKRL
jgi:hypothetical protein